jgi:hypothetical protein
VFYWVSSCYHSLHKCWCYVFFIETAGLLTTTTHSCFNGSVRVHSLLFTGFQNHVFNWDRLPYLRRGLIYVLMGPAHFGGVHLYTSSPCDSWVGCTPFAFTVRGHSGPPGVDYWGVHTLVVDVRRLSDSLVGYTCTPRHLVTLWWGKPVHLCQLEECSSQGFVHVRDPAHAAVRLGY